MRTYPDIRVDVYRGHEVESAHQVAAVVVDAGGEVLERYGDEVATFWRSSAKPFQALPWLERGVVDHFGWSDRELAIMCSSHVGAPEHAELVKGMLADMGLTEDFLHCDAGSGARHECSGNHCGFLSVSVVEGWDLATYQRLDHPSQQVALAAFAAACDLPRQEIATGVDGCGIVTYFTPITVAAKAFARLPQIAPRIEAAMRAHPVLVEGEDMLDTQLMRAFPGAVAKCGAEGLGCARLADGRGVVVKVRDGNDRGTDPALITLLTRLSGLDEIPEAARGVGRPPVLTSLGAVAGELVTILP
jgi:L-asparaginase II